MSIELIHGDRQTINISGLLDEDGNPAVFVTNDVVRFTVKRWAGQTDVEAFIAKTSEDGGIEVDTDADTGRVLLRPADFVGVPWHDLQMVWDLQLAVAGDETHVVTLARGTGTIVADITRTVLTGS